jgi:hypothetical protein
MDFDKNTGELIGGIPLWRFDKTKAIDKNIVRFFSNDIFFDKTAKTFYRVNSFQAVKKYMVCIPVSETIKQEKHVYDIKNLILCKTRADIAKIKSEFQKNT